MPNEEFEKKAEFVVEQQARLAAKIGQLKDVVAHLAKAALNSFEATSKQVDGTDKRISVPVNSQTPTKENVEKTGENLRNLVAVVDRYSKGLSHYHDASILSRPAKHRPSTTQE